MAGEGVDEGGAPSRTRDPTRDPTRDKAPAYRVLAEDLRAQITSGRLRPGDRLPTEPQLCVSSGVSRSTVREALRLLASEHLIVTTRGVAGGSFVIHPSPAQLSDTLTTGVRLLQSTALVGPAEFLEVRAMIEVPAAGLAAARRDESDLAALAAALFDPATTDLDTMVAAHPAFHSALARACRNTLLELMVQPLHAAVRDRETLAGLDRAFWARVDADHRAILDAVARQHGPAAEAASARHLDHLRATFVPCPPAGISPPADPAGPT